MLDNQESPSREFDAHKGNDLKLKERVEKYTKNDFIEVSMENTSNMALLIRELWATSSVNKPTNPKYTKDTPLDFNIDYIESAKDSLIRQLKEQLTTTQQ